MKKLLVFLVASLMVMSIAACGSSGASAAKQKEFTDAFDAFKTEYEGFETAFNTFKATIDSTGLDADSIQPGLAAQLDQYSQQIATSKTALDGFDKIIKEELAKTAEKDIDTAVASIKESTTAITTATAAINEQNAALEAALSGDYGVDEPPVDDGTVDDGTVDDGTVDDGTVDDTTTPAE